MAIDDDELARLRRRAYAADADIGSDPAALARLQHLERRIAEEAPAHLEPDRPPADEAAADESSADESAADGEVVPIQPARRRFSWRRPRRSTAVLTAVCAMVAVTAVVAVTLVQRVQTHPLQPDAEQVARVAPDSSFEVPDFFALGPTGQAIAFAETHGFRVVITPPGGALGEGEYCMTVFQPDLVTAQGAGSWSYSGQYISPACSAGTFPAAATVRLLPGSPELEHTDFPAGTALQFVYDQPSNEVVLFRG